MKKTVFAVLILCLIIGCKQSGQKMEGSVDMAMAPAVSSC
jgi:hypothetical protein